MTHTPTCGCSLTGPGLVERINEWAEVALHATQRTVSNGRIVSTYPQDQQLLERLRNLVAAEADCCPSIQFTIRETPEGFEVEIQVPDNVNGPLRVMLDHPESA